MRGRGGGSEEDDGLRDARPAMLVVCDGFRKF